MSDHSPQAMAELEGLRSDNSRAKRRMALAACGVAAVFLAAKSWGAWVSGSTGVLAMAVEALLDMTSALATYVVVRFADRPPDRDHPYGHGRYEQGAALFQAGLMFVMAAFLVHESISRWTFGHTIESPGKGMIVMAATGVCGLIWGRVMMSRARRTGSPSLRAFGRMVMADAFTDLGVLLTLALYGLTGWMVLDLGISLLVGLYILVEGTKSVVDAWRDFTDHRLSDEEEQQIVELCNEFTFLKSMHDLRTRTSGGYRIVDLHARFCRSLSLHEAHFLAERLTRFIQQRFPRSNVLIHADPCAVCTAPDCDGWRAIGEPTRWRVRIDKVLEEAEGDVPAAAEKLEVGIEELEAWLRRLGIDPAIYVPDAEPASS